MRNARWFVAAVWLTGMVGCAEKAAPSHDADLRPTEVAVTAPVQKSLYYTVEQPGRIEPFEQTPIYARISGYVRSVNVDIGERVKRGHVLAELDVPERVQEYRRKEALVAQTRLAILQAEHAEKVAEASLASARAQVTLARAGLGRTVASLERWRSEFQRMEKLVKDKVVDLQSADEMRSQVRSAEAAKAETDARITAAEAALAEAQARRSKAGADLAAARNQLVVAQTEEQEAKVMLDYSRITAPFDGVVADRQVDTGHCLQAATGSTRGKPLFMVVRMDRVRMFVEVPEADAGRVRAGNEGRITVQALNDREFVGKVAGTSWSLDPSQRTLRTEIDFENIDFETGYGVLRPGMYVNAKIDVKQASAWMIPAGAILVRDGQNLLLRGAGRQDASLAAARGTRSGEEVEVLKFQLPPRNPGEAPRWVNPTGKEAVILTKPGELIDNQPVEVGKRN